jgi:hypothetical protein
MTISGLMMSVNARVDPPNGDIQSCSKNDCAPESCNIGNSGNNISGSDYDISTGYPMCMKYLAATFDGATAVGGGECKLLQLL